MYFPGIFQVWNSNGATFPVTRIFDNIHQKLGSHLQQTLQASERMDVAVGYFNLRGWSVFDSLVKDKAKQGKPAPVVRILIGMVMTGPQEEALEELQAAVEGAPVLDADPNAARDLVAIFEANGGVNVIGRSGLLDLAKFVVLLEEGAQFQAIAESLGGSVEFDPSNLVVQWGRSGLADEARRRGLI